MRESGWGSRENARERAAKPQRKIILKDVLKTLSSRLRSSFAFLTNKTASYAGYARLLFPDTILVEFEWVRKRGVQHNSFVLALNRTALSNNLFIIN